MWFGVTAWVVNGESGYLASREKAFALARQWFPQLLDDELT